MMSGMALLASRFCTLSLLFTVTTPIENYLPACPTWMAISRASPRNMGACFWHRNEGGMVDALQRFHVQRSKNLLCVLQDAKGIRKSRHRAQVGRCSIFSLKHTHVSKKCV